MGYVSCFLIYHCLCLTMVAFYLLCNHIYHWPFLFTISGVYACLPKTHDFGTFKWYKKKKHIFTLTSGHFEMSPRWEASDSTLVIAAVSTEIHPMTQARLGRCGRCARIPLGAAGTLGEAEATGGRSDGRRSSHPASGTGRDAALCVSLTALQRSPNGHQTAVQRPMHRSWKVNDSWR